MISINCVQPKSVFLKCFVCWRPRGPKSRVWDEPLVRSEILGALAPSTAQVPKVESASATSRGSTFVPGQVRVLPYESPPFKTGMIKTDWFGGRRWSFLLSQKDSPSLPYLFLPLKSSNIQHHVVVKTLDSEMRGPRAWLWPSPYTSTKTIPSLIRGIATCAS